MILFSVQSSVSVFVLVTLVFLHISEFLASHSVIFTVFFRDVTSKAMKNNVFVLICLPTTRPFTNYPSPVVLLLSTEKKAGGGRHLKHFFPFSPSEISSSTLEIVQRADSRVLAVKKKKKIVSVFCQCHCLLSSRTDICLLFCTHEHTDSVGGRTHLHTPAPVSLPISLHSSECLSKNNRHT